MAFPSRAEYEILIYGLVDNYPNQIRLSTLHLYPTSALTAKLEGEIEFSNGLRLRVREFIDFKADQIRDYSYTIFRGDEKIRWYDPQPHPDNPELASTFPHHRHEPPDTSVPEAERSGIKHNRQPAPGITFNSPNLLTLIADCVELGKTLEADA
jgi:hypothetical protein